MVPSVARAVGILGLVLKSAVRGGFAMAQPVCHSANTSSDTPKQVPAETRRMARPGHRRKRGDEAGQGAAFGFAPGWVVINAIMFAGLVILAVNKSV
jgi:hypothetical protein